MRCSDSSRRLERSRAGVGQSAGGYVGGSVRGWLAAAAGVVFIAAGIAAARYSGSIAPYRKVAAVAQKPISGSIAWLVNAQDCRWAGQDQKPSRDMQAGKILRLERGLAEIEFDQGCACDSPGTRRA